MTRETDERYRAVVIYKKLRPYYPEAYAKQRIEEYRRNYGQHGDVQRVVDIYEDDRRDVGAVYEYVLDNGGDFYRSARGAKQAIAYHTKHHPFTSIYGDGKDSVEILSRVVEKAELVLEWRPVG